MFSLKSSCNNIVNLYFVKHQSLRNKENKDKELANDFNGKDFEKEIDPVCFEGKDNE